MISNGILYIDCPQQEKEGAFNPGREINEDEYVKMLREYSLSIGNNIQKEYNNISYNKYIPENINYSNANVKIYNISGNLCDINELYKIQENGMGVLLIEITDNPMNDSFESEFKFWKRESMIINTDKNIDKNDRIRFLPTKNLKFEIENHSFMLMNTKLYHQYDDSKIALIIQYIKEI